MRPVTLDYACPAGDRSRPVRWQASVPLITLMAGFVFFANVTFDGGTRADRGRRARTSAARADLANLSSALDAFRQDTGRYPTESEGLAALVQPPPSLEGWSGPYLKHVKPDPWGNNYAYRPAPDPGPDDAPYVVASPGPDGTFGNRDDIE